MKSGNAMVYLIANLERQTEKAILVDFTYSGSKVWLPKSQVVALKDSESLSVEIYIEMPYWLYRKNGGHILLGPYSDEEPATFSELLSSERTVRVA